MKILVCISLFVLSMMVLFSCTKENFITGNNAELGTSEDSLHFDTVFTTTGSVTQYFKIYNQNNRKLRISSIKLAGGSGSFFKINADGIAGPEVTGLEIDADDSLYVFVTVKIDQSAADLPFVVEDSIHIQFNGNERWVQLQAWGQNAHFLRSTLISSNTTWTNDRPYIILGGLLVAENTTLTIQPGTKIYLHADAPLFVDGTLKATGEKYDSTKIIFQGDRLDEPYRDYPGGWPGIYFREGSKNNLLKQVVVKNAYQGIVTEGPSVNANPKLTLEECIVDNCYDAGIIGSASDIEAVNCLISNCGKNIILLKGGNYQFTHCTDVAVSNNFISHKQPVLVVTNFSKEGDDILTEDLTADFTNCIFWGENGAVENEVVVSKEGSGVFNVNFTSCLWKVTTDPEGISSSGIINNEDPVFETIDNRERLYDFHLQPESPAIDRGIDASVAADLEEQPRNVGLPDLGAYEKQ